MSLGIACLLADDPDEALRHARALDALNRERRMLEADMHAEALEAVRALEIDGGTALPAGLCLYEPGWHPGVVGILASRIKDRLHRPVFAFASGPDGGLRGSGRSIPGLHLRDTLEAVHLGNPGLLTRFGGHAMAAGVTVPEPHLTRFAERFEQEVAARLAPEALAGVVLTDGPLTAGELELEVAEALRAGGPWGQGFPEPLFDGEFEVVDQRVFAERHRRLALRLPNADQVLDAVAWNALDQIWPAPGARVGLAYRLEVHEWQGTRSLRLVVEELGPAG
jgi:single-stranded-DNA-specific exonuclease